VRHAIVGIFSTSLGGFLLPLGLGIAAVYFVPSLWHLPGGENRLLFAMFIGTAMAVSALPVIARILIDLDLIHDEIGIIILAAAAIDDLLAWSLFALILNGFSHEGISLAVVAQSAIAIAVLIALFLRFGRSVHQRLIICPQPFLGLALMLVLIAAAITERLGIHAFFGAFLVGVALAQSEDKGKRLHDGMELFVYGFFAPIYFTSIGLKANFISQFDWKLVLIVFIIATIGKVGGAGLGGWIGKLPTRTALAVGIGLNARGAVELLLASIALDYHVIDQRIFVALITMAVVTSVFSSMALRRVLAVKIPA